MDARTYLLRHFTLRLVGLGLLLSACSDLPDTVPPPAAGAGASGASGAKAAAGAGAGSVVAGGAGGAGGKVSNEDDAGI